jgi:hypothetical protein
MFTLLANINVHSIPWGEKNKSILQVALIMWGGKPLVPYSFKITDLKYFNQYKL